MSETTNKKSFFKCSKKDCRIKAILKKILIVLLILAIILASYFAYIFLSFKRIEDNLTLDVNGNNSISVVSAGNKEVLKITSWNIGFGVYTDKFSFFMDGGKYSRGFSKEAVETNMDNIISELKEYDSDFYVIQEVDYNSQRSHKVDEVKLLTDTFNDKYNYSFAINYNSPYLFYPITSPLGFQHSGILTFSKYPITSSIRMSLPTQSNIYKIMDLDRAYSINKIPTSNGKELVLINFHLSAYTTDPTIVNQQLEKIYTSINEEYENGNYIICGGDFNMDLLKDSGSIFGISGENYSWAQPFPEESLPKFMSLVAPFEKDNPIPSARNADAPWDKNTNFQVTLDGFMVSDNVEVEDTRVIDQQFKYSDHQAVQLDFILK